MLAFTFSKRHFCLSQILLPDLSSQANPIKAFSTPTVPPKLARFLRGSGGHATI